MRADADVFAPDKSCAFDQSQQKCMLPPELECPAGFVENELVSCIPSGPCPEGYMRTDDYWLDRMAAECFPIQDMVKCPDGSVLSPLEGEAKELTSTQERCDEVQQQKEKEQEQEHQGQHEVFAPDQDCWYNPDQPKCTLPKDVDDCPDGFWTNEDAQCFKEGDCPPGFLRGDEDESGQCSPIEDMVRCSDGSILSPGWECNPSAILPFIRT